MADRSDYLRQLQEKLNAWAQWAKQLEEQALASAAQMRGDAQVNYDHRARQVSELVDQGRLQFDRVSSSTEDAWRDMAAGAEQVWGTLQSAAAELAQQVQEKMREPVPQKAVSKKKPAARKPAPKPKKRATAKKKVAAARKKVAAVRKKVVGKAKALIRKVKVKARRRAVKRKVAAKVRQVRRKVAKVTRKAVRKKK